MDMVTVEIIPSLRGSKVLDGAEGGESLYKRLKREIANLHSISEHQVDIFTLRDVDGGVDVRYNCHSSPYYSAARLNAILLQRRQRVAESLGVEILLIDMNLCLYEELSPCGDRSCQHTMRPNLTSPLVVASETSTMVGVDITDDYACGCGESVPSECSEDYCYNGGTCLEVNRTLTCACLDDSNYGPRCELMTARFERGFAWYEPPNACENSSFSMVFETNDASGVLFYTGPIVTTQQIPRLSGSSFTVIFAAGAPVTHHYFDCQHNRLSLLNQTKPDHTITSPRA
ncbi:putative neural-cadherin 2 [Penaeus japonicus]|uniref:putative neural-cadherin 2 n=1 Tax=Penaeus japonicus TaxID=27405 RepID=UPI001C70AFD4|nr:putative neural-cadherin 2 [Penaeus japonicus]